MKTVFTNKSKIFFTGVFIFLVNFLALPSFASAVTWHVRVDGGDSTQCDGQTDAPYPGEGTGQACAVNHPFWLFPPGSTPIISGGDTVVIGSGSYKMGAGAPNTSMSACNATWTYDCVMPAIPSGPDSAHPTKIIGQNSDTKSTAPPELWGSGRATQVISLIGSSNIVLQYLDITDHAECGYNFTSNPSLLCDRTTRPYGDQADAGIHAKDSANVLLKDIKIHGLSSGALWGGRLTDWTFDGVEMHGNAFSGWNGDVGHGPLGSSTDSSMHGTIMIKNSKINYTGCVENYPLTGVYPDIATGGCYGQGQGGYGDAIGTYYTEGDWIFQDTEIMYNTQDGLDMLYHLGTSGSVELSRVRIEGNAGQQIKIGSNALVENSVIVGNCNYFFNNPIAYQTGFPHCRAAGTPIVFANWRSGHEVGIINSVITGPNKIFIENGVGGSLSSAGLSSSLSKVGSITSANQYIINEANDTMWVRLSAGQDPDDAQIVPRIGSGASTVSYPLSGTWIPDGGDVYHLTGIGGQTEGNYDFSGVFYATVIGSVSSIVYDSNYAVNKSEDTLWVRLPGNQNPNDFDMRLQFNNYITAIKLAGTWIDDGNGIYHLIGVGAQTNGFYAFNSVSRSGICDGSQKLYSRNNIFAGSEWWSTSSQSISPGVFADTFYLSGWNGNGEGSCAATDPIVFDNKDSIVFNSKYDLCSEANNVLCLDPLLENVPPYVEYDDMYTYGVRWNVTPQVGSPALDKSSTVAGATVFGSVVIPSVDFLGNPRPFGSGIDWGAYEVGSNAGPDTPVLSGGVPIATTKNPTPYFTFTSTEDGTITYGGSCSSITTSATAGENVIVLNNLNIGTYSDCALTITDSSSNVSTPLTIPTFHITYPGDIDLDKDVDIFDYNTLLENFGTSTQGDPDDNNIWDIFDYNLLVGDFGRSF